MKKAVSILTIFGLCCLTLTAEARHSRRHRSGRVSSSSSFSFAARRGLPALTPCQSVRIVEMHNALLAAQLLCKDVIPAYSFNAWVRANNTRISTASKVAVKYFMHKYGSRARFDRLDTATMMNVSLASSQNPALFCERMTGLNNMIQSTDVDTLLETQTMIEVPSCGF